MLHQQRCCTGAQPHHGHRAPSSPHPGQGWHPRGPTEPLPGHRAEAPACSTAHKHPGAAQRAWLGCSPFSSSPAELRSGRGTQPCCTQLTLTVSPLLLILLLFPCWAPLKGGEPAAPLPAHITPKPFPSAPAHSLGRLPEQGQGLRGGSRAPRCHAASEAGSSLPAQRQLHREGALKPQKYVCKPAQPCPVPKRLQEVQG